MSRTMPGNETEESREAFRRRIQRFAGVEIAVGFDTVPPRLELVEPVSDEGRLKTRMDRFVHRLDVRV